MPQKLGALPLEAKIKYGSLYDAPIIWKIADKNHEGYPENSVTLVTNQIIKLLCFDAKEPDNDDSGRKSGGNSRYIYSNVRQWLNSDADAGQWYTPQHSADAPPNSENVWGTSEGMAVNPYDTIAGFLNSFTEAERAVLLLTTITVGKSNADGGGTETCVDKVFLLSCTETGIAGDHVCGSKLAIFSDDASRIATVTASCVANSNFPSNPSVDSAWIYWLRDARANLTNSASYVRVDGAESGSSVYYGNTGLRPACNLTADLIVSDMPDADGCYTIITVPSITVPQTAKDTITVRVKALDSEGHESEYATGAVQMILCDKVIRKIPWQQGKPFKARQYTYNGKKQYQTMREGALAGIEAEP